jgi:hypothetical protein
MWHIAGTRCKKGHNCFYTIPNKGFESQRARQKIPILIYLALKKETHRLSRLDSNFHPNLAIRDKLTSFIKRKPKPPWSLGRQREAQDLRVKFRVYR